MSSQSGLFESALLGFLLQILISQNEQAKLVFQERWANDPRGDSPVRRGGPSTSNQTCVRTTKLRATEKAHQSPVIPTSHALQIVGCVGFLSSPKSFKMQALELANMSYESILEAGEHHNPTGMGQFIARMSPRIPHVALAAWVAAKLPIDGCAAHGAAPQNIQGLWWLAGRHAQRVCCIGDDCSPEWRETVQLRRFERICAWMKRFTDISRWDGMERGDAGLSPMAVYHYMWGKDPDGRWGEDRFEAVMRGLWKVRNMGPRVGWHCCLKGNTNLPNPRTLIRLGRMQAETCWILLQGWEQSRRLNYEAYAQYRSLSRREQLTSLPRKLAAAIMTKGESGIRPSLGHVQAHEFQPTLRGGLVEAGNASAYDMDFKTISAIKAARAAWPNEEGMPGHEWNLSEGVLACKGIYRAYLIEEKQWVRLEIAPKTYAPSLRVLPAETLVLRPEGISTAIHDGKTWEVLTHHPNGGVIVNEWEASIRKVHGISFGVVDSSAHFCFAEVDGAWVEGSSRKGRDEAFAAFKKAVREMRGNQPAIVKGGEMVGSLAMAKNAGFCYAGTTAFLRKYAPYLGHLLSHWGSWEKTPQELLNATQSITLAPEMRGDAYLNRIVRGW